MGAIGSEVSGDGLALLPVDTSKNADATRDFMLATGIDVSGKIIMSTDGPVLQNTYDTIIDQMKQHPDLISVQDIKDYDNNNAFAATNGISLAANTAYFGNTQGLATLYQGTVDSGFHPAGTTWKDIVSHELGHIAVRGYIKKQNPNASAAEISKLWASGSVSGKIVNDAINEIKKNYKAYGFTKVPTAQQLRKDISRYATKNRDETIAEAWADFHANGGQAKVLSRVIYGILTS